MSTHEEEGEWNLEKLRALNKQVFRVKAVHAGGRKAEQADDQECGLEKTALLAEGARVMLRSNIWTTRVLTNGAMGEVVDVIASANDTMPMCVLVRFPSYAGPAFFPDDPEVAPAVPKTANFGVGKTLRRTQIPLTLCWATTIHKSQGATYARAVISLGKKEMQLGLSYVALSRVTSLAGLLLVGEYSVSRMFKINLNKRHRDREVAERRLSDMEHADRDV